MNHTALRFFAVFTTLTALLMAAIAAINRGGTFMEQILLVMLSVMMVLGVHLLPAISRRLSTWLLWFGCFVCAIFGHLTFLTHSTLNAVETRTAQSAQLTGIQNQIALTRESLSAISARPVSIVAAELAQTRDWKLRPSLRTELDQAKRAEALRADLVRLSASSTAVVTNAGDPVMNRIAAVTGLSEQMIGIGVGVVFSVILELVGALLWFEVFKTNPPALSPTLPDFIGGSVADSGMTGVTTAVTVQTITQVTEMTDHVSRLRFAIESGDCRPTVAAIRAYLNCSQERAMNLRREVLRNS